MREPGTLERVFGGVGRAPGWSSSGPGVGGGLGGVIAGSFFGSMAGTVLGSLVAQQFFTSHPEAHRLFGAGGDSPFYHSDKSVADDLDRSVQEIYGDRTSPVGR